MKLLKLLFLYFLSFTGFLCYGDSFNGMAIQRGSVNISNYFNGKAMYYVVSGEQWNELPDEIKKDVFQIDPEQIRAFFNSHGLNTKDMVGHYIGSMGNVEVDVISGKIKMLVEIYTSMGMENHGFYREEYNGGVVEALIAGSSIENMTQILWGEQQNWGMNIKVMGKKAPKVRMLGALTFDAGVVDSVLYNGVVRGTQWFANKGVEIPYIATTAMEDMQGIAGKVTFIKNNTNSIQAEIEKGLGIDMKAPQNLQFYVAEPIGGGGGAILASMGFDVQDYVEFAEKIGVKDIQQQWEQVLERGQIQENNIPAVWFVVPSNQVLGDPAFFETWSDFFNN